MNSTKSNLAEDTTSEDTNLIGSLSRHSEDSLNIENLAFEGRQNLYGPELDIRPLEIPGAVIYQTFQVLYDKVFLSFSIGTGALFSFAKGKCTKRVENTVGQILLIIQI